MEMQEMSASIERVEKLTKRGLLTVCEAEKKITAIIDSFFPDEAYTTIDKWNELNQRKRLAHRRKWRFLLELSKDPERVC